MMNVNAKVTAVSTILVAHLVACHAGETPSSQADDSISRNLGPEGGTVELVGIRLRIPAGALQGEQTITITRTEETQPARYEAYSPVYRIEPEGLIFSSPLSLSIDYMHGQRPQSLFSSHGTSSMFEPVDSVVGVNDVTGDIYHFSPWFAGADTFCRGKDDSWWCTDDRALRVLCLDEEVVRTETCACRSNPGKNDACIGDDVIEWPDAPWAAGKVFKVRQGYHLGNGVDIQDADSCNNRPDLYCNFDRCLVTRDCRGTANDWGLNLCLEELAVSGERTGRWQFLAHLSSFANLRDTTVPRQTKVGVMGNTGRVIAGNPSCSGIHVHLEQGGPVSDMTRGGERYPNPPFAREPDQGMLIRSAGSAGANYPPSATITSPQPGTTTGAFRVQGSAEDADGLSKITIALNWPNGSHLLPVCDGDCGGTRRELNVLLDPASFNVPVVAGGTEITLAIWVRDGKNVATQASPAVTVRWLGSGGSVGGCGPNIAWRQMGPLPEPDQVVVSSVVGSEIHVFGWTYYSRHRVYSPLADWWSQKSNVPQSVSEGAAAAVGALLYVVGDGTIDGATSWRWDSVSDTWAAKATNPWPRRYAAAVAIDTKIYLAGGYINHVDRLSVYDTAADTWTDRARIPSTSLQIPTAVNYGGRLFLFGTSGSYEPTQGWSYNPADDTWHPLRALAASRYGARAIVHDSKVLLLGGINNGTTVESVHVYDPSTDTWCDGASLPQAMSLFAAGVVGNKVYLIGGLGSDGQPSDHVWEGTM